MDEDYKEFMAAFDRLPLHRKLYWCWVIFKASHPEWVELAAALIALAVCLQLYLR